jgi:hypothetical protein
VDKFESSGNEHLSGGGIASPIVGGIAGVGMSLANTFLVEKLIKGWKPNQFVGGPLLTFVDTAAAREYVVTVEFSKGNAGMPSGAFVSTAQPNDHGIPQIRVIAAAPKYAAAASLRRRGLWALPRQYAVLLDGVPLCSAEEDSTRKAKPLPRPHLQVHMFYIKKMF